MYELAVAQGMQPATKGADPERTLRILVERTDLIAGKAVSGSVLPPLISHHPPEALPVGARPNRAVPSLGQRDHKIDQQRTARDYVLKLIGADHAKSRRRREPKPAVRILDRIEHSFPCQPIPRMAGSEFPSLPPRPALTGTPY